MSKRAGPLRPPTRGTAGDRQRAATIAPSPAAARADAERDWLHLGSDLDSRRSALISLREPALGPLDLRAARQLLSLRMPRPSAATAVETPLSKPCAAERTNVKSTVGQRPPSRLPAAPRSKDEPAVAQHATRIERTADEAQTRHEQVVAAAHYLFLNRGFAPGRGLDDWLAAERQCDRAFRIKA